MTPRWRLFPKYALLIIALVSALLSASGAVSIYFSYRETREHLVALQVEKAQAAATRIEQFILDIDHQLGWTALPMLASDGSVIEQRRIEYLKLLRQTPAITEVAWIDATGHEQLRVSRLAMDAVGGGADLSQEAKFKLASGGGTYYGSVYFRKETEPYMTIARPAGSGGGVTTAEVNLKFVWDVVSRIKIGAAGLAYVVDASGALIAHPDISLVLKKTDLKALPQVAAMALPESATQPVARDFKGDEVFAAHARIPTLNWTVFVESPRAEAFAPLYASILRTGLLLVAGLFAAVVASFFLARALVKPLRALHAGAAQIGAGELDHHIEVHTGDELEGLAEQFNKMGADLKASYAGLERKVEARTAELSEALDYQTAISNVLRVISQSPTDVAPVFEAILDSAMQLLGSPHASIYRYDGHLVHLVATRNWPPEAIAVARAHFPMVPSDALMTGRVIRAARALSVEDVLADPAYDSEISVAGHWRRIVATPMLKDGAAIGVIAVAWPDPGKTPQHQVELLKTFADQAVIAIENVRLFNETREALEQQTATADILKVISESPMDVQPVFDAIAERAMTLCDARISSVTRFDGEMVHLVAYHGVSPEAWEAMRASFPMKIGRGSANARAMLDRVPVQIADLREDPEFELKDAATRAGFRAILAVPMLRDDQVVGALTVSRQEPGTFPDRLVRLLQTFADQAVIAIENVRLFNETREALEQQTAMADILKVISESPTDVQPVFDAIAERAMTLCDSRVGGVAQFDGEMVHLVAYHGVSQEASDAMRASFPMKPGRGAIMARTIHDRVPVQIADVLEDPDYAMKDAAMRAGFRSNLAVPMFREGQVIGSIAVCREEPGVFPDRLVRLLQTFAAQAVIAIENVRLFNETREALERQTATAEILQVISSSVADAKPVFEAILRSCERLFDGLHMGISLLGDDGLIHLVAQHGPAPNREAFERTYPVPLSAESGSGAAILERRVMHYPDVENGPDVPLYVKRSAGPVNTRSVIIAPLLWEGRGIGAIFVGCKAVGPFSEKDITLLKTFADQAVIAIQNARLFNETKEALDQQTATAEVLQVISSSVADARPVFDKILDSCERLFAATSLGIYLIDDAGMLQMGGFRGETLDAAGAVESEFPRPLEGTATALAIRERRVVHYPDVLAAPGVPAPLRRVAEATRNFSIAFAPMLWEERGVGAIQVSRDPPNPFTDKELTLLKTFADQAVIAIQNERLFNEIQNKSRELESANKHKSEFLANMSHELRTPLNAIIGFSEVLSEKMFGDVNEKQLEYLLDIHTSGHHLLSLINDILDLAKIEAGRMELDLASVDLAMLLDNCTTLVRERASRQGLTLALDVEAGLGEWVVDVRKLKQIVINLLSNAVKFTPAGGRVTLRARTLEHAVEIAVIDTGLGIAADQQALVFEEFRQAGGDYLRKSEGSGLGLSLAKRFVELHGGSIRIESEPGRGSTFAVVLPERVLEEL